MSCIVLLLPTLLSVSITPSAMPKLRCLTTAVELILLYQNSGKIRTTLMIYFLEMDVHI